jgi:hypothetical protein
LDGVLQRALQARMHLLVVELLAGQPLGGRHQRRLAFQVARVPGPRFRRLQADQRLQHVQRRHLLVAGAQDGACLLLGAAGARVLRERAAPAAGTLTGDRSASCTSVSKAWRASPARRCSAASSIDGRAPRRERHGLRTSASLLPSVACAASSHR